MLSCTTSHFPLQGCKINKQLAAVKKSLLWDKGLLGKLLVGASCNHYQTKTQLLNSLSLVLWLCQIWKIFVLYFLPVGAVRLDCSQ